MLRRIALPALWTALVLAGAAAAEVQPFAVDSAHTVVKFEVKFLGLVNVEGRFGRCGGDLQWDPANVANSTVQFAVDTASIDTGNPARDKHLRSGDFFAADSFPQVTFRSKKIERSGDGFVATGDFSLHGVTKELRIPFTMTEPLTFPGWDRFKVGCTGRVEIDRLEFGIGTKQRFVEMAPNGARWASQTVPVEFQVTWNRLKISTRRLLNATIAEKGMDAALKQYRTLLASPQAGEYNFSEREINLLGYDVLGQGKPKDAIRIFELNVENYPKSPNVYDSLAEAYMKAGNNDRAIANYRKSLELNPGNKNATEMLAKLGGH